MRDLYVLIDDAAERNIPFNRSLSLDIEPGTHRIRVTNRMYSEDLEFSLRSGETARFEVANVTKPGLLGALAMSVGQLVYKPTIRRL